MIERALTDWDGQEVLNLHRVTREQAWMVRAETLPRRFSLGGVVDRGGSGVRAFVGSRGRRADQLKLSILTAGQSHADNFAVQQMILNALERVHGFQRSPGGLLDIAVVDAEPTINYNSGTSGTVNVTAEVLTPYWWTNEQTETITPGAARVVLIGGEAWTGIRVTITAGSQAVTDPVIVSDAGESRWNGTIPAGQTLTVDNIRGWRCLLGNVDASLGWTGPLPYLTPGERTLTVTAPGATAELTWREGTL